MRLVVETEVTRSRRLLRWGVDALLVVVVGLAMVSVFLWWHGEGDAPTWRDREGNVLPNRNGAGGFGISMGPGPEHCHWENVTFLNVAWPPGSVVPPRGDVRQFVHDPNGLFDDLDYLHGRFQAAIEAPADAVTTGVHTADVELWVSPSDPDAVFLRNRAGTFDRWPRADPKILCA